MLNIGTILFVSFAYLGLLFAIAYYGDKRADQQRSIISNPYIYALSLAVYCTAWTFYGSVGMATGSGIGFLPIYIGPTLMATLGWLVLRKIIRISKIHHITSIADWIASRYGKSMALGVLATIIAVLGVVPYISLQLKAISNSLMILRGYPSIASPAHLTASPFFADMAFYITIVLAVFAILFGTRHLDATERHEGLVAAIAFESIVKLAAFIAVGVFVTYTVFDGFGDIAARAADSKTLRQLFVMDPAQGHLSYTDWSTYLFISMMAVVFLPRQFQVAVVENVNEKHLHQAIWFFPLYLLAINVFVLPIAFGGALHFSGQEVDPDFFALALPMAFQKETLALLVFIGGTSAATGMVIVETVAMSTMICNELAIPVLLRLPFKRQAPRGDMSRLILRVRRAAIVLILLLGYTYFRYVGEFYTLVSIGLTSFSAIAQFAPAIIGGLFWKEGTRAGAISGLAAGFIVWSYTLIVPALCHTGILPLALITAGPFGLDWLNPHHLFGLHGFNQISHAVFWSMLINLAMYVGVSLFTVPTAMEHTQASLFVDVFKFSERGDDSAYRRITAMIPDLRSLLAGVLGTERAEMVISGYARQHQIDLKGELKADPGLVSHAEKVLGGVIGSVSAHVMVASVVKEEPLGVQEVMEILDETRQAIAYGKELERVTTELQAANEKLKALDQMKDEFMATVTHELRTPLTSIRSLTGILHDNPDLEAQQRLRFSGIIIQEGERLTRLINNVLDFQRLESDKIEMQLARVDLMEVIRDAVESTKLMVAENKVHLFLHLKETRIVVQGDRDRLIQVMLNLISNGVKFCRPETGTIDIKAYREKGQARIDVQDNGPGIRPEDQPLVFERFWQARGLTGERPSGSGLGLAIAKQIVERHQGRIWVASQIGAGSTFSLTLPLAG
jgi:Na+/proline symporter/nitrogen-specific signal transduction histidine kinase